MSDQDKQVRVLIEVAQVVLSSVRTGRYIGQVKAWRWIGRTPTPS